MRAVVIDGAGSVRVNTQPDPALPGPDGVVVAVTAAGICGSDLHFYEGEYPFTEPVALGHEAVGTIVEAGPQVRTVGVGDLVMVSSVAGCGVCPGCETHDPVMCFSGPMIFGAGVLGGAQADLLAVPAADFQVLKIPKVSPPSRHCCSRTTSPPVGRQPNEPIFHSAPPWRSSAWEPSASARCAAPSYTVPQRFSLSTE